MLALHSVGNFIVLVEVMRDTCRTDKRPTLFYLFWRLIDYARKPSIAMAGNKNLQAANKAKKDEFYTQLCDIENELRHYREHFRGKTVLCNCDDPRVSNFFHYFAYSFEQLGLKRLITTCYKNQSPDLFSRNDCEQAVYLIYEGDRNGNRVPDPEEIGIRPLRGDGDFRSPECIELLKQADIVVTNPPFSLFREYVGQLVKYEKKFLIIGNKNAITYKECFTLIKDNKMWTGCRGFSGGMWFQSDYEGKTEKVVDGRKLINVPSVWYTNLDHQKRHEELIPYKKYTPEEYPKYDNYDAINVDKTVEIPYDYDGVMGVPITFLDKYNPEQFEIVGCTESEGKGFSNGLWDASSKVAQPLIKGRRIYKRLFIKRIKP